MAQRMASRPVREHGPGQQHHDQNRQQPSGSEDQLSRQRHVNASYRKECKDHLPAWLRSVDLTHRHGFGIAGIMSEASLEMMSHEFPAGPHSGLSDSCSRSSSSSSTLNSVSNAGATPR